MSKGMTNNNPRGAGGKREGAGRKPDEVKALFEKILVDSKAFERLSKILKSDKTEDEVFIKAFALTADRAFGKAKESVSVGIDGNAAEFLDLLARADARAAHIPPQI